MGAGAAPGAGASGGGAAAAPAAPPTMTYAEQRAALLGNGPLPTPSPAPATPPPAQPAAAASRASAEGGGGGGSSGGGGGGVDELQPAMDVFSCGCVLIELFLEDHGPPFELPQLLRYLNGDRTHLDAILTQLAHLPSLCELLRSMTLREPSQRPTAAMCLSSARASGALDETFYSFASGFFGRLRLMDQASQASELCDSFELLVRELMHITSVYIDL